MCLLYCACHAKFIFPDPFQMPHACHRFWNCYKTRMFCSLLTRCTIPCACQRNDMWTSKSGPNPSCFLHFWLRNVLRATTAWLFRHLNCQKWSEVRTWCALYILIWKLRATTACTFSTSQLPKVVREWCVLYILTWTCASRHNGVQFFISHLASWLRTRRFSEPTFRPSWATNQWKTTVFRDFPTFSRTCIFFLLTLSLLWSSLFSSLTLPMLFHVSVLSEVWLLNFLRLHLPAPIPGYWSYKAITLTIQGPTLNCLLPWIPPPLQPIDGDPQSLQRWPKCRFSYTGHGAYMGSIPNISRYDCKFKFIQCCFFVLIV